MEYRSTVPKKFEFKDAGYKFTEAASYKGPVVPGWPPGRDRDVAKYIRPEENTVITGERGWGAEAT